MRHTWKFFRAGGVDQVCLESAADLTALHTLDQKLWVALSCPTGGVEFDTKTLDLLDSDRDGRIRAPEVLAAVAWTTRVLNNPEELTRGEAALPLASINTHTEEGQQLLASAQQILDNLGKGDAAAISIADTTDTAKIFSATKFNGDGVITLAAAPDETTRTVIEDVMKCLGAQIDRSGAPGIDQPTLDAFFRALQEYSNWWQNAEQAGSAVLPLGDRTASAWEALGAVRTKVDDYFAHCRLAAYDVTAGDALNPVREDFHALARQNLATAAAELAQFPLAKIAPQKPLPLTEGLNPAWAAAVDRLRREVVTPLFGESKAMLTNDEWTQLLARFADYQAWLDVKAGVAVEPLGLQRVRAILTSTARRTLDELIAKDKALEPAMNAIAAVDKLVRYYRDLHELLNNFVSFRSFYARGRKAIFQVGTLYLDGRACDLCVRVQDMAKHAALASFSKTYLVYCDCTRRGSAEKMTIAAAITAGDSEQLMVGRNGVFYDRKGQDWDATIVKIVDHPISIRQAILAPYRRIGRMVSEQIEKFAAARDKAVTDQGAVTITEAVTTAGERKTSAAPAPFDVAKFAGIFAAIGLAIGALGTALASIVANFMSLRGWQMPLAILGVFVAISGPSMIIAALKLRERNLGPLLDANGWAVNGRVRVNIPFGASLTTTAKLPPGAQRSVADPYKSWRTQGRWWWLVMLALGAVAYFIFTHLAGLSFGMGWRAGEAVAPQG